MVESHGWQRDPRVVRGPESLDASPDGRIFRAYHNRKSKIENQKEPTMRKSKTLAKLRIGQPVRLCSFGHFIPAYVGHAAKFGFDCIWLDLEHRAMDNREVQSLLALMRHNDIDCMLRPPTRDRSYPSGETRSRRQSLSIIFHWPGSGRSCMQLLVG